MAKAKKKETTKTKTKIQLTLTDEEAKVLAVILAKVGGDPATTSRGVAERISKALYGVGCSYTTTAFYTGYCVDKDLLSGGIEFKDVN